MIEPVFFIGSGIDTDNDIRFLKSGDGPYRENFIYDVPENGKKGDGFGVKSNVLSPFVQPVGTNKKVGGCKDVKTGHIYYAVHNSNGLHNIRRWNSYNNTVELVLEDASLNFKANRGIQMNIIDGKLYWTDGYFNSYGYDVNNILDFNPPRKINIQKALNYTNGLPGGYNSVNFEILDRLKYQPPGPPISRYLYDSLSTENYIYGKLFQFMYRYIFDDKEVSTWSSLGKVLMPLYNYQDNSIFSILENNIGITIQTGEEIVRKIEIGFRLNGFYFIAATLDKTQLSISDNTSYEFIYDGISYKESVPTEDFLRPFDYVPQISGAQEIAANRIFDGDIVENYDKVDVDMNFSFIRYDKTADIRATSPDIVFTGLPNTFPWGQSPNAFEYPFQTFKSEGIYLPCVVYLDRGGRSGDANTRAEYKLLAPSDDIDSFPTNGIMTDPLKLRYEINHTPPVWAKYWYLGLTKDLSYLKKRRFVVTAKNFNLIDGTIKLPNELNYSLDVGDKIRLIAITSTQETEANPPNNYNNIFDYNGMANELFHLPFSGSNQILVAQATNTFNYKVEDFDTSTRRIKVSKTDAIDMLNYILNAGDKPFVTPIPNDTQKIVPSQCWYILEIYNKQKGETENKIFYDIGERFEVGDAYLSTRYHKCSVQNQVPGIQPAIGEVFGFDTYLRRKKTLLENQMVFVKFGSSLQFNIAAGTNNGYIELPYSWLPAFDSSVLSFVPNFEGPLLVEDFSGFGFGGLNFFGFTGPKQGQGGSSNLLYLDCNAGTTYTAGGGGTATPYGLNFNGNQEIYPWLEDESFSDDYISNSYNDGRVNSTIESMSRKRYPAKIRWSGKYFENTFINNLSSVDFDSFKNLEETYNEINRIIRTGFMLKVRQRNKNTSIPVDRIEFQDSVGHIQLVPSSQVLGEPNPSIEDYGSIHPFADIRNERHSYWPDVLNGVIVRDSYNGMVQISGNTESPNDEYKMTNFFRTLFKEMVSVGIDLFEIVGAWDGRMQSYILTIIDSRPNIPHVFKNLSQTLMFHEPSNRWKTWLSHVPESYESIGKNLVSFKNGELWVHHTGTTYNNFYGQQYTSKFQIVSNVNTNSLKIYNSLDVYTTKAWDVIKVRIDATNNSPNGMLSKIPKKRFKKAKEGVFHSDFLKDMNDPAQPTPKIALQNGRELRGEAILLEFEQNGVDLVTIKSIAIHFTPSEETL